MPRSRSDHLQALLARNISKIIQSDLKNPHLGFLSIPEVKVSSDLSYAKVYVSFFKKEDINKGMQILEKSKGFIRSQLAKMMDTRRVPLINFVLDDSFNKTQELEKLIDKVNH